MDVDAKAGLFVLGLFVVAYLTELVSGRLKLSRQPRRDALMSMAGLAAQAVNSGPVLGGLVGYLMLTLFPEASGGWSHWPLIPAILTFLMLEDFLHYWLHRYAHEWRWLWKLHRTHHSGTAMNTGLVFRYNVFWTLLLPQAWISGVLIYMGLPEVFLVVATSTFAVNVLTHTGYRWDLRMLERFPVLKPLWLQICRVITTPDTHHAHHGMGREAHSRGNYAVVFFLWDTLFGTARIPMVEQTRIGLPHSGRIHWAEELFWPVVRKPLAPKE